MPQPDTIPPAEDDLTRLILAADGITEWNKDQEWAQDARHLARHLLAAGVTTHAQAAADEQQAVLAYLDRQLQLYSQHRTPGTVPLRSTRDGIARGDHHTPEPR